MVGSSWSVPSVDRIKMRSRRVSTLVISSLTPPNGRYHIFPLTPKILVALTRRSYESIVKVAKAVLRGLSKKVSDSVGLYLAVFSFWISVA